MYDILDDIQNEVQKQQISYEDLKSLNRDGKSTDNLILYLNIRSLNANLEKLQILIKRLKIKPYVIVCAETWNLEHYKYHNLNGYEIYYNNSKINKSDGVVVYVKKNINQTTNIIEIGKLKILNTIINLNNNSHLEISAMYRSHDLCKSEFILNVKKYLIFKSNVKNHLVIGDYNINILQNSNTSQEFLNNFLENGYFPGFTDTTRPYDLANENGTCIDNIFIKASTVSTTTFKLKIPWPDHFPLFINVNKALTNREQDKNETKYTINYKTLNIIANEFNWNQYKQIDDPNEAINKIIEGIHKCVEKSKIKSKTNKNNSVPRKEWITNAIVISCKKKEKLYERIKKDPGNNALKQEYKNYIKVLDKVIKDAKIKHDKEMIEKNSNNPKQLWSIINSKIGNKNKKDSNINEIINENKESIKDQKEIANTMNDFYCNMGEKMSKKILEPKNTNLELPEMIQNTIFIKPTDSLEIKKNYRKSEIEKWWS